MLFLKRVNSWRSDLLDQLQKVIPIMTVSKAAATISDTDINSQDNPVDLFEWSSLHNDSFPWV